MNSIFDNLTLYLEFHVPHIIEDFEEDPYEFLNFFFKNLNRIEFNRNHWGSFKGMGIASEINSVIKKNKDEISIVITDIISDCQRSKGQEDLHG